MFRALINIIMTRPSKQKSKVKKQERDNKRKFSKKLKLVDELKLTNEFDEQGDDNDSGWDDDVSLLDKNEPFKLAWSDNTCFEKKNMDLTQLERLRN